MFYELNDLQEYYVEEYFLDQIQEIEIQEGEESVWQYSDFGSISVFETKMETQK